MASAEIFTLAQLRYFIAAAESRSMTQAAHELYASQSTVSTAISKLERQLGVKLFVRHPSEGLLLTPEGRRLLDEARILLARAGTLIDETRSETSELIGELSVGSFPPIAPFYLATILAEFARQHPHVDLNIIEGDISELQDALLARRCEVALTYDIDRDGRLAAVEVASASPYVIVGPSHRLANREEIRLQELESESMVLLDLRHSREYFQRLIATAGFRPTIRYRTANYEFVRTMVANGLGYAILNQRPAGNRTIDGGQVVSLELLDSLPAASVVFAHPSDTNLSRRASRFIELALDVLRK